MYCLHVDRCQQKQAKAKALGAPDTGVIGFCEFSGIGHFQHASKLNATVAGGMFLFAKVALHHGADFQWFVFNDPKSSRFALANDPCPEFIGIYQGNTLAILLSLPPFVALHKAFRGIGTQVERIIPMREKGRAYFPASEAFGGTPLWPAWLMRRQEPEPKRSFQSVDSGQEIPLPSGSPGKQPQSR